MPGRVPTSGKAEIKFTAENGEVLYNETVFDFKTPGVLMGMYNKDDSIISFARACFNYALSTKQDLWFSTKDTISKKYDHTFKDLFQEVYEKEYKADFETHGLEYFYTLIDDAVARNAFRGGFIWAGTKRRCYERHGCFCFRFTGYVTSVLVSPTAISEPSCSRTVTRHYYKHLKGRKPPRTQWLLCSHGQAHWRSELDNNQALVDYANKMEQAALTTIESGYVTKDLASLVELENIHILNTEGFILKIKEFFDTMA